MDSKRKPIAQTVVPMMSKAVRWSGVGDSWAARRGWEITQSANPWMRKTRK